MLNDQIASTSAHQRAHASHSSDHRGGDDQAEQFRDIHALAPPPPPPSRVRRREAWEEAGSQRSSSLSSDAAPSENFSTMSREFSALVLAGSTIAPTATSADSVIGGGGETDNNISANNLNSLLARIGEDDHDHGDAPEEETNPLAIVPDNSGRALGPAADQFSPRRRAAAAGSGGDQAVTVQRVKKEEVEAKISAWQNAKVAKVNNRFKREEAVISGLESEQVQKATSWMKKVERKLEEKRARALEKMQNDVAKARRKAEERRASAEAKRGTKVARVFEIANLMRAVGRAPAKRSFF